MVLLQRLHAVARFLECRDAERGRFRAAQRRHDRRAGIDGGRADFDFVGARRGAARRVDDELDFLVLEQVNRVGPALGELENALHFQPGLFQNGGGAAGGDQFKTQFDKLFGHRGGLLFVRVAHADENLSAQRQGRAGGDLRFRVGDAEVGVQAHDLAGRAHFRREQNVLPVKTVERENRLLHRPMFRAGFPS